MFYIVPIVPIVAIVFIVPPPKARDVLVPTPKARDVIVPPVNLSSPTSSLCFPPPQ